MEQEKRKINVKKLVIALAVSLVLVAACIFVPPVRTLFKNIAKEFEALYNEQQSPYPFNVHVIDVGQGDSILVTSPKGNILIDAGADPDGKTVINYIKGLGIKKLDYVIPTHAHSDHIGGMTAVLKSFEIGNVILTKYSDINMPTTSMYQTMLLAVKNSGAGRIEAKSGNTYSMGKLKFTVLGPISQNEGLNNMSVVVRMTYGERSFLFMGDAEKEEERDILASGLTVDSDFIKVGHHGSSTSSSEEFIKAVSPMAAAISCAKENDYGHPHKKIVKRLDRYKVSTFITYDTGTVIIGSDGNDLVVTYGKKSQVIV
ncbi:MAG: MBL fold metallo-hydrolase [Clostridiales bacterium]|nr:MBL fold metallo-hydrolase [Clostridiales bacterium]